MFDPDTLDESGTHGGRHRGASPTLSSHEGSSAVSVGSPEGASTAPPCDEQTSTRRSAAHVMDTRTATGSRWWGGVDVGQFQFSLDPVIRWEETNVKVRHQDPDSRHPHTRDSRSLLSRLGLAFTTKQRPRAALTPHRQQVLGSSDPSASLAKCPLDAPTLSSAGAVDPQGSPHTATGTAGVASASSRRHAPFSRLASHAALQAVHQQHQIQHHHEAGGAETCLSCEQSCVVSPVEVVVFEQPDDADEATRSSQQRRTQHLPLLPSVRDSDRRKAASIAERELASRMNEAADNAQMSSRSTSGARDDPWASPSPTTGAGSGTAVGVDAKMAEAVEGEFLRHHVSERWGAFLFAFAGILLRFVFAFGGSFVFVEITPDVAAIVLALMSYTFLYFHSSRTSADMAAQRWNARVFEITHLLVGMATALGTINWYRTKAHCFGHASEPKFQRENCFHTMQGDDAVVGQLATFLVMLQPRVKYAIVPVVTTIIAYFSGRLLLPDADIVEGQTMFVARFFVLSTTAACLVLFATRQEQKSREKFVSVVDSELQRRGAQLLYQLTNETITAMFPPKVAIRLLRGEQVYDSRADATAVCGTLLGFTSWCSTRGAAEIVELLERSVVQMELLASEHGIVRLQSVGDMYVAVSGLVVADRHHTQRALRFARAVVTQSALEDVDNVSWRICVESGPLCGTVVGKSYTYIVSGAAIERCTKRLRAQEKPGIFLGSSASEKLRVNTSPSSVSLSGGITQGGSSGVESLRLDETRNEIFSSLFDQGHASPQHDDGIPMLPQVTPQSSSAAGDGGDRPPSIGVVDSGRRQGINVFIEKNVSGSPQHVGSASTQASVPLLSSDEEGMAVDVDDLLNLLIGSSGALPQQQQQLFPDHRDPHVTELSPIELEPRLCGLSAVFHHRDVEEDYVEHVQRFQHDASCGITGFRAMMVLSGLTLLFAVAMGIDRPAPLVCLCCAWLSASVGTCLRPFCSTRKSEIRASLACFALHGAFFQGAILTAPFPSFLAGGFGFWAFLQTSSAMLWHTHQVRPRVVILVIILTIVLPMTVAAARVHGATSASAIFFSSDLPSLLVLLVVSIVIFHRWDVAERRHLQTQVSQLVDQEIHDDNGKHLSQLFETLFPTWVVVPATTMIKLQHEADQEDIAPAKLARVLMVKGGALQPIVSRHCFAAKPQDMGILIVTFSSAEHVSSTSQLGARPTSSSAAGHPGSPSSRESSYQDVVVDPTTGGAVASSADAEQQQLASWSSLNYELHSLVHQVMLRHPKIHAVSATATQIQFCESTLGRASDALVQFVGELYHTAQAHPGISQRISSVLAFGPLTVAVVGRKHLYLGLVGAASVTAVALAEAAPPGSLHATEGFVRCWKEQLQERSKHEASDRLLHMLRRHHYGDDGGSDENQRVQKQGPAGNATNVKFVYDGDAAEPTTWRVRNRGKVQMHHIRFTIRTVATAQ